jgi:CRISPR system Cascade subunit CasE
MSLCLVRAEPDPAAFGRWAASHRFLPQRGDDLGYALHAAFKKTLGDIAPRPFYWRELNQGQKVELLGYSHVSAADTKEAIALANADANLRTALGLDSIDARDMPAEWRTGRRLSFECRVRPVVRHWQTRDGQIARGASEGARQVEVDAAVAAWTAGERIGLAEAERPTKEAAYTHWLSTRFERGGARLEKCRILSACRSRVLRRPKDDSDLRRASTIEGPDVVFRGELAITDAASFAHMLGHGVGRHCSFGFGLLLVTPPGALS